MSESKKKAGIWGTFLAMAGVIVTLLVLLFSRGETSGSQAKSIVTLEKSCQTYGEKISAHDTAIAELRTSQVFFQKAIENQDAKLDQILQRLPRSSGPGP